MRKYSALKLLAVFSVLSSTLLFTSCPPAPAPGSEKPDGYKVLTPETDFTPFDNETGNAWYNLGNYPEVITVQGIEDYDLYVVTLNRGDTPVKATRLINQPYRAVSASEPEYLPQNGGPIRQEFRDPIDYSSFKPLPHARSAVHPEDDIMLLSIQDDTRQFWVCNNLSSRTYTEEDWSLIDTRKVYSGTHCDVYVDDNSYDTANENTTNDGKISRESLKNLGAIFDSLYALETSIFGPEYKGPKADTWQTGSLIPDGKIAILVHDINNDKRQDSGLFGMFWSKDLWKGQNDGTIPDERNVIVKTNQAEMFYIDSWFMDCDPNAVYSTLSHELQHMLHFANKQITDEYVLSSPDWYNEMLSMVCEDLLTKFFESSNLVTGFNRNEDGPFSRTPTFNRYYIYNGIKDWYPNGEYNLWSYASAYTFGSFLIRNYGGVDLVKAMARNKSFGDASITQALAALGKPESFETVFLTYALSVAQPNATYMTRTIDEDSDTPLYPNNWWDWWWKVENEQKRHGPWNYTIDPGFYLSGWGFVKTSACSQKPAATLIFEPSYSKGEYVYLVAVKRS